MGSPTDTPKTPGGTEASNAPDNLADLVRLAATRWPDALAYRDLAPASEQSAVDPFAAGLTWGSVDAEIDRTVTGLQHLGLAEGDRVVLARPPDVDTVLTYLAILRAGLIAVPSTPDVTRAELAHVVADSQARALLAPARLADEAATLADSALTHVLRQRPQIDGTPEITERGGDDLAVLLYGGPAGGRVGAMLSHQALLDGAKRLAAIEPAPLATGDVLAVAAPTHGGTALQVGVGLAALAGAQVVCATGAPHDVLRGLSGSDVTHVLADARVYTGWCTALEADESLRNHLAGVKLLASVGAIGAPLARRLAQCTGLPLVHGYGRPEAGGVITATLAGPAAGNGVPLPGVELRVAEDTPLATEAPVSSAQPRWRRRKAVADVFDQALDDVLDDVTDAGSLDATGPGEIVVRAPGLFQGYWPDGRDAPQADGWWRTGDIGYVGAGGELHVLDRASDLILVQGFRVYPREVRDVLRDHPLVADARVLGVEREGASEVAVTAYVVPADGARLGPADLLVHCEQRLARFKRPHRIVIVDTLPGVETEAPA